MGDPQWVQRCERFIQAVSRLDEACAVPMTDLVRDAIIHRFELCWELAWKAGQIWLAREGVEALTPRAVWTGLLSAGVLSDGNRWSRYQRLRNLTSHTYDESLAKQVAQQIRQEGMADFKQLAEQVRLWAQED